MYKYIFSILLVCFSAIGRAQTIDGKLYTPFNNYYQWIGGKFNSNLNIPKVAATTGRDTGGIRYNLTDSSMYVWTGSQWRQVGGGAVPTLQQVTTAGNTTTDSLNIIDASSNRLSSLVRTQVGGPTDLSGRLILRSNFNSNYALYNPTGITYLTSTNTTSIAFPDTGITSRFATRVAIDGNTYAPSTGGLINLGNTDTATVVKAYVTNAEAVTITKGQVVYIFGASGDRAAVKLAKNTSDTFSSKTLGIVRADIAAGQAGWVTTQGQVSGINLGAYTAGDILWLDSVAGGFTKTKPVAPYHSVFVGVVERANAGNGLIYVKPQNGQELGELHDTKITSPTNNQVLAYTAATDIWENKSVTTALGYTPLNVTDTAAMLNGRLSGITLNTSSAIHTSPVTFSRVGGAWSGTLSLANQSGFTVFRRESGTGTPSFGTIDSSYFGGNFKNQVDAAQSSGINWTGGDSLFSANLASNGEHNIENFNVIGTSQISNTVLSGQQYAFVANSGNLIGFRDAGVSGARLGTLTAANSTPFLFGGNWTTTLSATQWLELTSDYIVMTARVRIPTLSDGTNSYNIRIGLMNSTTFSTADGALFVYDLSGTQTGSSASANWQTLTALSSARTYNQNYTGTAVSANTWTKLRIVANSSNVFFYINNTLVATHVNNLPTGQNLFPFIEIRKTLGATARTLEVDYSTIDIKYSTPR